MTIEVQPQYLEEIQRLRKRVAELEALAYIDPEHQHTTWKERCMEEAAARRESKEAHRKLEQDIIATINAFAGVIVCEGGGPADIAASVAVSMSKLKKG
jgi:hypothetical protein